MTKETAKGVVTEMIQEVAVGDGTGNAVICELQSILTKVDTGELSPSRGVEQASKLFIPAEKKYPIKTVHH